MKKGFIFVAGLALVLGCGVAVGAHSAGSAKEVGADTPVTLYLDTNKLSWYGDQSRAYLYGSGGDNTWPGESLTHVSGSVYKLDIADASKYQNVIFLRSDGTNVWNKTSKDGGVAINLPADWSTKDMWTFADDWNGNVEYNDGNYTGSWSKYVAPTTVKVAVYVDGAKRGDEDVEINGLPDTPTLSYGKYFSGWFDDAACSEGHEVTKITEATTVYGKRLDKTTYNYTINKSAVSDVFKDVTNKFYSFDDAGERAAWPGEDIVGYNLPNIPVNATIVVNSGEAQTVNVVSSNINNDVLVIDNAQDGEGKYLAHWASSVPATEGYYIKGLTDWSYAHATKMTAPSSEGNLAHYYGLHVTAGQEMRACSYYTDRTPYEQWADCGNEFGPGKTEFGEMDGDNFKFLVTGDYDVYVKYDEGLKFYVAEAAEHVMITLVGVYYEGNDCLGSSTVQVDYIVKNQKYYVPENLPLDGFYRMPGAYRTYSDYKCSNPYVDGTELEFNTMLFVKYMKVGYYMISEIGEWSIDNAIYMNTEGINPGNKAEYTLEVNASNLNKAYSFVYYNDSGTMDGTGYTGLVLSEGQDFAEAIPDTANIKFTKVGVYSVYWSNDTKVYLNAGLTAFLTNFLSVTGGICKTDNTTDTEALASAWEVQASIYNALSADEKAVMVAIGIDGGSDVDDAHRVVARYAYIVKKYGTETFTDFIFGESYEPENNLLINHGSSDILEETSVIAIVSVVSVLSISAIIVLVAVKKRKHN